MPIPELSDDLELQSMSTTELLNTYGNQWVAYCKSDSASESVRPHLEATEAELLRRLESTHDIKAAAKAKRCRAVKIFYTLPKFEDDSDIWEVTLYRSRAATVQGRRCSSLTEAINDALECAEKVNRNENAKRQLTRQLRAGTISEEEYEKQARELW